MNRTEFFDAVRHALLTEHIIPISHAYWLTKHVHRNQVRDEGGRYFEHCRRVANILFDHPPTSASEIIVALLHDCEEDGFLPEGLLDTLFNSNVARAVDLLSKVRVTFDGRTGRVIKEKKSLDWYFDAIARAENMVRRVKCADRIHNLSTMHGAWPPERKAKYIAETRMYLIPIAEITDTRLARLLHDACE
ncbi:MAG: HD domain-containing protein [Candidatus Sungbacteria bacterium]|nr:HD domain-containing protein [bacterium]MDZ4260638.1 HD domain-containing protein [Candidatus Sungbacteria bacterium]